MGLPYSFQKYYSTKLEASKIFIKLEKSSKVKNIFSNNGIIEFNFISGFWGLKTKVNLYFRTDKEGFYYEFFLLALIKFAIILIILLAFIISDIKNLLIFSTVSIFTVYSFAIYQINSSLETIFDKIIGEKIKPEEISPQQKKWIEDLSCCPACGCPLTEFDNFCPDCNLNLSNRQNTKKQPVSRTGYHNYRINYSFYNSSENKT